MAQKYYKRSGIASIAISAILLAIYLALGHNPFFADLIVSEWFLDLLPIPLLISVSLSGFTYIGRAGDLSAPECEKLKAERFGTYTGLLLGCALGIALSVVLPIAKTVFGLIDAILFTVSCISSLAGLGNRLGVIYDEKNGRPRSEKQAILASIAGSTVLAATLLILGKAALLSIAGVTTLFSGGSLIPLWAAAFIFISSVASAVDYSSKMYTALKPNKSADEIKVVETKKNEYRFTVRGILLGIVCATIIVGAIAVTHGIGILAALMVYTLNASAIGGLFSRLGKIKDIAEQEEKLSLKITVKRPIEDDTRSCLTTPLLNSQPVSTGPGINNAVSIIKCLQSPGSSSERPLLSPLCSPQRSPKKEDPERYGKSMPALRAMAFQGRLATTCASLVTNPLVHPTKPALVMAAAS